MRKLLVFALMLGICGVSFADEKPAQKEAIQAQKTGNICYTENIEVTKGSSFPVKVYISNADTLAGMQVPIYYRSEDVNLVCDSVSFSESRCKDFAFNDFKIEPVGRTVYFGFIYTIDPNQTVLPMPPGDGPVATLWFTAPKDIKSGEVPLESGPNAFYPHPKIDYSFLFWNPAAEEVSCTYKGGTITVK